MDFNVHLALIKLEFGPILLLLPASEAPTNRNLRRKRFANNKVGESLLDSVI